MESIPFMHYARILKDVEALGNKENEENVKKKNGKPPVNYVAQIKEHLFTPTARCRVVVGDKEVNTSGFYTSWIQTQESRIRYHRN